MRKLKIVTIIIVVCVLAVIVGKLSLDLFNKIDDSNNETETTTEYEEETTEQEVYYDCTINPVNYTLLIGTDAPNIKTKVNIEFRTPTADVLHSEYFILDEDKYELSENLYIAHIKVDKNKIKDCDSDKIYAIVTITDFVDDKSLYKENLEIKLETQKPTEEPTTEEITEESTEKPTETTLLDIEPPLIKTFKGSGDDVITDIYVDSGSIIKFVCADNRHKSVKAHHDDTYELLLNETKPYSGITFLVDCYDTYVDFEINASSDWTLEIYELGSTSTDSFSGNGDYVTPMFYASSNVYEIQYSGERHIAVKGYYDDFDYDLLVNEIGSYSGKVYFTPKNKVAFFTIETVGEWSIKPIK